jgi:hypothetical protein
VVYGYEMRKQAYFIRKRAIAFRPLIPIFSFKLFAKKLALIFDTLFTKLAKSLYTFAHLLKQLV